MNCQQMLEHRKRLASQMTAENKSYYSEMVTSIVSSELSERQQGEVLLDLANTIIRCQKRNRRVEDVFGDSPTAYCEQWVSDITMGKPRLIKDKIRYYTLIPWVALTWVFFIYMIVGFVSQWVDGEFQYTEISISSLLLIAIGSIVLMELLTKFMRQDPNETNESSKPSTVGVRKFNAKIIGVYLVILIIVVLIGSGLNRVLPSFTVSPWGSFVIFAIGVVGYILWFGRRRNR